DQTHKNPQGEQLKNYWGYSPLSFFAPKASYATAAGAQVREFKQMVKNFHEAGIEVILDVVYNHTAEGNELGPTLSFKGIDNASYYRLAPDKRFYINDTGTGNTLNLSHPVVIQMVCDSLRYWAQEMHVDGFRFDLGTILAREPEGFDHESGFLKACMQDPVLASVKLIAEPWDCGPGGYQVGGFPPGWAEWNDKFRDTVRDYWRGEALPAALAPRLCASGDVFNHRGRKPWASVNFVAAHDGFTVNDLVTYNDKHNEANGEDNNDGSDHNRSWNCGAEGPTDDEEVNTLRMRQIRNLLSSLLLAQGTPMLLAGDEFGRTQEGNNNTYCQDNALNWLNWERDERGEAILAFARTLTALRAAHPALRYGRFLGRPDFPDNPRDLVWLKPDGAEMDEEAWNDERARAFGMLIDTPPDGEQRRDVVLLALNGSHVDVSFTLPESPHGGPWRRLLDTDLAECADEAEAPLFKGGDDYPLTGRSLVLLEALQPG
ncbi:MAG: glycogen debranching protein GlgX, partial [Caulobacteraceae bacterium]|nr:glycogen debranching protein GlgX [Caulobacteraceae bacterium]